MMTKDNERSSRLDNEVATIARAGADAVAAKDRTINISAQVGDVQVVRPYAFAGDGNLVQISDAVQAAQALYDKAHPDRVGTYEMADLASVLAWAARYTGPNSAAFVEEPSSTSVGNVTVVVDELPVAGADGARRVLRASTGLMLHDRLRAWLQNNKATMKIDAFSDFASRASDELTGAELISMINNVEVKTESNWKRTIDNEGKIKLVDESSASTSRVPSSFTFKVPVFDTDDDADGQTFTARLTTRIADKKPVFTYEITDFKPKLAAAMKKIRDQVAKVVPTVYAGTPPG